MEASWTVPRVEELAPDPRAAKAAHALASPRRWAGLGRGDEAIWGCCAGSGASRYQTAADLDGPAFRCSCPSRKLPCKHALGLLLSFAQEPARLPPGAPPAWVAEWLGRRRQRARSAPAARSGPADPAASARRAADRAARIGAGLAELERWLRDLVRQGFAAAQAQPYGYWDTMAARMVDAQAAGVAGRVRRMAGLVAGGEGWPGRLLEQAGLLHLVTSAWPRIQALPPALQADLRAQVGRAHSSEEVLATGAVRDHWYVLGRWTSREDPLWARRTWLWALGGGQPALILEFAPAGRPFATDLVPGTCVDAGLAFHPGGAPLRALVAEPGPARPGGRLPGFASVGDALGAHARAIARSPWVERFPFPLAAVTPCRRGGAWLVRDAGGALLPLRDAAGWRLAALSGGWPIGVFGEWEDGRLRPLSAFADDRLVPL
ncbi:MAG TPA: SWIM zinc finger family protein [Actinomycetes bacterium]|nr:SWIM zinc finger family protein [Actinomycetes bacterium]